MIHKFNTSASILLALAIAFLFGSLCFSNKVQARTLSLKDQALGKHWPLAKPKIEALMKAPLSSTTSLYNAQQELSGFLEYAIKNNHNKWIEELMLVYSKALPLLTYTNQYTFYYVPDASGVVQRSVVKTLTKKYPMWLNKTSSGSFETVLDTSQFLYAISSLFNYAVRTDMVSSSVIAQKFVTSYREVILSTYRRLVLQEGSPYGAWQTRGWGCVGGTYSHYTHLLNLISRKYGTSKTYCNALLDVDLFIISGVANMLDANRVNPRLVPIASNHLSLFRTHLANGLKLFNLRTTWTSVVNFSGKEAAGFVLDPGAFDGHPDYAYSGDTAPLYPGWSVAGQKAARLPKPAKAVGWDLSHSRRLVNFLFTLSESLVRLNFISKPLATSYQVGYANQFAYKVFNRNFTTPGFANYWNGTDGWYRVNYANRPKFGYASRGLSIAALEGGFMFWSPHNEDIKRISKASWEVLMKDDRRASCLRTLATMPDSFFEVWPTLKNPACKFI